MESVTIKKENLYDCEGFESEFIVMDKLLDKNSRNFQKCGEIFISEEDVFNFLCILCEAPFEEVEKFFIHIKSIHKNSYCVEKADPLGAHDNENQCEYVKLEPDIEASIVRSQLPQVNCLENISNEYNISNQESLGSIAASEESSDGVWHNTRQNTQRKKTRTKFESNSLDECAQKNSEERKSKNLLCDTCSEGFTTYTALRKHSEKIHNISISLKKKISQSASQSTRSFIQTKLADLRKSQEEREVDTSETHFEKDSYKCRYCDRQFIEKKKLEEHETIYCGDRPCECQTCGKQFKTRACLWRHETTHTNTRDHKCDICKSTFKSKSGLYSHTLRHGEKKYACSYCGKLFSIQSEKREHERVHTGERSYQCTFCGKSFQTSGSLSYHVKSHTGRRPHKCQYCDKGFYTKAMLNNHVVIHTGERPFVCSTCKATFPRKKALKSHEKIHSDLRGYVCKICGEAFKQYAGLYCHKKIHGRSLTKHKNL